MTHLPFIHQTPAEALQQVVQRRVQLNGKCFEIAYPGNPDALLDHPATHAAFHQDEYMPYWADLWPSAQMLGEALLRSGQEVLGQEVFGRESVAQDALGQSVSDPKPLPWRSLEIGCGVGLPGIVALSLGMEVIFSDYDTAALEFAQRNAIANGFATRQFELLPLDWRSPPTNLQVDLLLASDVIYEQRNIEPLVALIKAVVLPGRSCWLVDPNRPLQSQFEAVLASNRLRFSRVATQLAQADGKTVHGSLFKIRV